MTGHESCLVRATTMFLRALGLIGALTLASVPRLAHAQEDPKMLARRHFDRGMELVGEGAYAEALVEFSRAHEISPHYAVLYNIGQTYVALGRPVESVDVLTRYLDEGRAEIPAERRRQVETEIAKQKARIAELDVRTDVPGALVTVDGKEIGRTPFAAPVRLAIGTHRVVAAVPGRPTVERSVTVAGEEKHRLDVTIPQAAVLPVSTPAAAVPPPPPPTAQQPTGGLQTTLGYVAGAIGVGLGGATVAHYFWNKGRYDTWSARNEQLQNSKEDPDYDELQQANNDLSDSIDRASVVTVGLGIGAGVMLGTGVVLVLSAPSPSPSNGRTGAAGAMVTWQGVW